MTTMFSTRKSLVFSMLALVLCVSMLLGTTFAWFTDSVSSNGSIIQSGTLKIGMEWADGKLDPANVDWADASETAIFEYANWEPGYVQVRHVKISNKGTLGLKYLVNIKANGDVSKLAEAIDVYFVDPAAQIANRSDLADAYKIGSLADVWNGVVPTAGGDLLVGESDIITIALKMQESAGNEYQNLSLGGSFSVQVLATQLANENDSFGNDYDADAVTFVEYDSTKSVAENANTLYNALNNAEEGDIILIGAGNWYATTYKPFTVKTDNVTVMGVNGTVLGFEAENRNSIMDVYGDNVTIRNITFNANKNEYNQCILATGAENLTVDGCTFYGENYQGGNTPTLGIYLFENLDIADDEKNDEITKYTITNNSFLGASVGSYKGGANTVPNDPGVAAAQVSEDMVIANNIFVGANVLIENWRSWSKECTRDHEYVPTIENNIFQTPNLCFANTPHSIYLRCYRQGNPDQILPADYMDAFVANNTIATPANDTVVTYGGVDYVLSNNYGTFYRDNATYGVIAYCYGQSYAVVANGADDLAAALASGATNIQLSAGTYTFPASSLSGDETIICAPGTVFEGTSSLNINGATIIGATFDAGDKNTSASGTINGTFKDCTFTGASEGVRWCYTTAGTTTVFENCVFEATLRGIHFDGMDGDVKFINCEVNGFNAIGGSGTVTFEGCTFGNDASNYNGLNMYCNTVLTNCTFNYLSGKTNFIDFEAADKSLTITNCTATLDGEAVNVLDFVGGTYRDQTNITVDGVQQ